jgi:hypothetical protein
MNRLLLVLALSCFASIAAHADTTSYTISGTFTASTPSTAFSGPSEPWASSFQVDSNPIPTEFGNGGFDLPFSNFSYSLNGLPVAIAPTFIRFFTASNGGGFGICFNGTTVANCTEGLGNVTFGPQLYTGQNSAPTLSTGAFTFDQGNITVQANTIPEPSTLVMLATALMGLAWLRLYWR